MSDEAYFHIGRYVNKQKEYPDNNIYPDNFYIVTNAHSSYSLKKKNC